MEVTAKLVKELRQKTGAGMMDCKRALVECDGNLTEAAELLRKQGIAKSAKKADRIAAEGVVESYIHLGGKIGSMVEVNCETDFAAQNQGFRDFARDIAMHIAAANPTYLTRDEIPVEVIEHEKEILREQALNEGKPEKIVDRMVEGRLGKFFEENVLMDQKFVKDTDKTIEELVKEEIAAIGENVKIRRFARFGMGEGLEKKEENFAEEVAAQQKAAAQNS